MAFKDWAGGLFGGVGSVISGAIGAKSTSDTNKTNLKINQMNNDFNAREAQKARDFQLDMWNKENEYNKASSQRKRLEEAGYNPYMSDAQAGTAAGMSGTSAATAAGAAPQIPYTPDFQSVGVNLASTLKMMSEKKPVLIISHKVVRPLNLVWLLSRKISQISVGAIICLLLILLILFLTLSPRLS